jgi:tetratricopeptide (TPR) repeat protein
MILRLPVLLSLGILGACASSGPQAPATTSSPAVVRETAPAATSAPVISVPEPIRVEPAPRPSTPAPVPEPAPQQRPSEPATPASTLLASVDQAIAAGDLERAAALSERALRISPRDAYLWYRLANIRYVQRQYNEAEGFARRALSFAGNDRDLTQQINQLLTQVSAAN